MLQNFGRCTALGSLTRYGSMHLPWASFRVWCWWWASIVEASGSSSTWRSSSWTVWTLTLGFLVLGLVFCGAFTVTTTTEMLWRATNCFFSCCLRSSWRPQGGGGGALPLLDHGRWNLEHRGIFFQKLTEEDRHWMMYHPTSYSIIQESGSIHIQTSELILLSTITLPLCRSSLQ